MRKRTREIDAESLAALHEMVRHGVRSTEAFRARAVLAFFEGSTYKEIHTGYGWASATTALWLSRFRAEGVSGLGAKVRSNPPGRVRGLLEVWLPTVVHKSPRGFGREQDRWTLEALQAVCERQTGERPSLESIRLALHRFGHSWKRAKRAITSPDPEYEAKKGQSWRSSRRHRRARE